jgi:hypothetical protein
VDANLNASKLPAGVQVVDFGIRSYDLAYALTSGRYDAAILVDAGARGGVPDDISLCCSECESPSSEILQGRELQVVALELRS